MENAAEFEVGAINHIATVSILIPSVFEKEKGSTTNI